MPGRVIYVLAFRRGKKSRGKNLGQDAFPTSPRPGARMKLATISRGIQTGPPGLFVNYRVSFPVLVYAGSDISRFNSAFVLQRFR